jgi:hypothetical protein
MSYLMPALIGGSSIYGAVQNNRSAAQQVNALQEAARLQAEAQGRATDAQTRAGDNSLNFLRYAYDQSRADTQPWRSAGGAALGTATGQFNQPFEASPGYGFARDEGIRAIQNGMAAKGLLNSTAAGKMLARYGAGAASQEYGNYANRLMQLAGLGQNAAGQGAAAATGFGQNAASVTGNLGNNLANLNMAGANTLGANIAQQGQIGAAGASAGANALLQGANGLLGYWSMQNNPLMAAFQKPRQEVFA